MKFTYLLILLMFIPKFLHSQCNYISDANIIRTNPDNYYNPSDPQALKMWDWRGNTTYSIYLKTSLTTAVSLNLKSPFWADNTFNSQDNIDYLRVLTIKDYEPIDGWELIYKNFGLCCNINDAVSDPSFALYNKYNSTLRIFVYVASNSEAYNSAVINLTFDYQTSNIHSYCLSENISKITALDKKAKKIIATKVNRFNNGYGYWLHADFPMSYDPCACNHFSIMSLEPKLVKTGNLEIEIVGKAKQEVIKTGISSPNALDLSNILSEISGAYSAGNAKYKTWNDFKTNTENTIQTQNDEIKSTLQSSFGSFPEWTKMIPEIGRYIGIFEYFTGGGQKDVKSISPTNFDISLKSTSTSSLTFTDPYGATKFYTPGSNYSNNTTNFAPVYDEPMGIFNLLETPRLEFYGIIPTPTHLWGQTACINNQTQKNDRGEVISPMNQAFPMIRHYKIKNNLKYVLNPRANVEVISIEAQIVFKPKMKIFDNKNGTKSSKMFRGPVEVGELNNNISYADRMKNIGLNIDYWPDDKNTNSDDNDVDNIIYSTRLLPGSCFDQTSFKVFHLLDDEKSMFCKIIVKLRRKDGLGQDILMVKMYNIDIAQAQDDDLSRSYIIKSMDGDNIVCDMSRNFVYSVASTPFSNTLLESIPDVITLSNIDFSNDNSPSKTFIAWSKINIGPNVIFPPGMNVTFQAGKEIITDPNFQSSNNSTFLIQLPTPCNNLLNNSNSELSSFCSTIYDPVPISTIAPGNISDHSNEMKEEEMNINIQVFPNPVDDNLNILIFNNDRFDYAINLVDITGKTVYSTLATKNESMKQIDVSELSSGIYILVVQFKEFTKQIKVVVN